MKKIFSLLSLLFSLSLFAQNFTLKEPYEVAEYIKKFGLMGEILAYKNFDIPLNMPLPPEKFLDPEFKLFRYQVDHQHLYLCAGYAVGEVYQYYLKKMHRNEEISFDAIFDFGNVYIISDIPLVESNFPSKNFSQIFLTNLKSENRQINSGSHEYLNNEFFNTYPLIFLDQYPQINAIQGYLKKESYQTLTELWQKLVPDTVSQITSMEAFYYPYYESNYQYYQYGEYRKGAFQIKGDLKNEEDYDLKSIPLGNHSTPQTAAVLKNFNPDVLKALIVKGFPPIIGFNSVQATTKNIQVNKDLSLQAFAPQYIPFPMGHVIVLTGYGYYNDELYFLALDNFHMQKYKNRPVMYFAKDLKKLITSITIIPGLNIDDEAFYIKDIP